MRDEVRAHHASRRSSNNATTSAKLCGIGRRATGGAGEVSPSAPPTCADRPEPASRHRRSGAPRPASMPPRVLAMRTCAVGAGTAVLQQTDEFGRRRPIGDIGQAHQNHLRGLNRRGRGLHLVQPLQQHLPQTGQRRHRQFLRKRPGAPRSPSASGSSAPASGANLIRVSQWPRSRRSWNSSGGSAPDW